MFSKTSYPFLYQRNKGTGTASAAQFNVAFLPIFPLTVNGLAFFKTGASGKNSHLDLNEKHFKGHSRCTVNLTSVFTDCPEIWQV
jgi:hypothetical protein